MGAELFARVRDLSTLQNKLMLLTGEQHGCLSCLAELASETGADVINLSSILARNLAKVPERNRGFEATNCLQGLLSDSHPGDVLLLKNLELLFLPALQVNPLEAIKRLSHATPIVAIWPGELVGERLRYAAMGHPEYREYSTNGIVITSIE